MHLDVQSLRPLCCSHWFIFLQRDVPRCEKKSPLLSPFHPLGYIKIFGFNLSPPFPFFYFFPSFSPLSFCVFLASKDLERKMERDAGKENKNRRRAQEREKEIALVWKARFLFNPFRSSPIDPPGVVTQSWAPRGRMGCVPFRWRSRRRQGWSRERGSRVWGWCCWPRGRGRTGRLWLWRRWPVQHRGSGPCVGG